MKQKQKVTQTSIQSYRHLDHTTLRGRIGGWIVARGRIGAAVSIRQISEYFRIDKSTASGRMNELKKGVFEWDGTYYRLEFAGKMVDPVTLITVEMWWAAPAHNPGTQADLFTSKAATP